MTWSNGLVTALALLVGGCDYNYVKSQDKMGDVNLSAEAEANPDFSAVQSVVLSKCVGCHSVNGGNKGGLNLESYESVRSHLGPIEYRALKVKDMPPGGLGPREADLLSRWYDNGNPLTVIGIGEKPDPSLGRGPDNWSKVSKVFARKCTMCHAPPSPQADLDLTDVKAARAAHAKLHERMIVLKDMPMAPIPALTPIERRVMMNWFDSGMPE